MTVQTEPRVSRTERLSSSGAAVVLAAPVLLLGSELIAPREPSGMSDADQVAFLTAHADRLTLSWAVGLAAAAALATAYVLIVGRLRGRGLVVGRCAGVLGVLGAASLAAHMGASLAMLDVALSDSRLTDAVAAVGDGRAVLVTLPFVILGLNLAIVLLAVAAVRAGWAPWWIVIAAVGAFVGDWSGTNYNTVIHAALATVVLGLVAVRLRSDVSTR